MDSAFRTLEAGVLVVGMAHYWLALPGEIGPTEVNHDVLCSLVGYKIQDTRYKIQTNPESQAPNSKRGLSLVAVVPETFPADHKV